MKLPHTFRLEDRNIEEAKMQDLLKFKGNVMIDPSLLLASRTMGKTFKLIKSGSEEGFKIFLPHTFRTVLTTSQLNEKAPLYRFFLQKTPPSNLGDLNELLEEHSKQLKLFEVEQRRAEKYQDFMEALLDQLIWYRIYRDDPLLQVVFEEWVFLQEYSWIVSRSKKTFSTFMKAGALSIEIGHKFFKKALRKTLKKSHDHELTPIDYFRAIAKWTAVGGASAANLISQPTGAIATVASGFFLLMDP